MALSTDYISTGGGKLYIQLWVNGVLSNDTSYFGITDEVTLTSAVDQIEHPNTETNVQRTDKKVAKKKTAMVKFTTAEVSPDMLARAFVGKVNTIAQTAQTAQPVTITSASKGFVYDIGYVAITALVVKDATDITTYTLGTDYTYDANSGMIEILPGGTIADAADLHLTVTADAHSRLVMAALTDTTLEARLIFISDPQSGSKWKYTFKKVSIVAQGDIALKGEDFATIEFEGEALVDDSVTDPNLSDYFDAEELPNA